MANSPDEAVNSHAYLYKYKERHQDSQHERRLKLLVEQKEKRHSEVDKNRQLCDEYLKELEEFEVEEDDEMEYEQSEPSYRRSRRTKFRLMLTEWFTDIPDDLEENWVFKLTPEGFRVLLLAYSHRTVIFTIKGKFLFKLKSHFPGGGGSNINGSTVLDCIYNKDTKTFFVLDCLYWSVMYTLDSEANFRFYWLKTKFNEMPELSKSVNDRFSFNLVDDVPMERSLLQEKMSSVLKIGEHEVLYDGIVFYHKNGFYTFGYSPLATWLFSYMLPEKLGIDVPEVYQTKKPEGYVDLQHFIENKSSFLHKKKRNKRCDIADMES